MNKDFLVSSALMYFFLLFVGGSLSVGSSAVVNLMIDINAPVTSTEEQKQIIFDSIVNLTNVIDPNALNVTLFPTGEAILSQRLQITYLANASNYEVAMAGMKRDENLGNMSYSEQESLIAEMKRYAEACHICRGKAIEPVGLKPQSFNQNAETYQILNGMGMSYDAGFMASKLYIPGHENDTWPYRIDNLDLYAVPISTGVLDSERIILSDRVAKIDKKLSGSQWYDFLADKFNQSVMNGDPLVAIFDNEITGTDADYLDAFKKFLNYAIEKNASFVTTSALVDISRKGGALTVIDTTGSAQKAGESVCETCNDLKNTSINITSQNATASEDLVVDIRPSFKD